MNFSRGQSVHPKLWLAASGLLAVSAAAPLKAQNTAGQIQLELSNTPLVSAIDLLMQRSGANIVVNNAPELAQKKVTVNLNGKTVEEALNTVLKASNVPWYHGEDGVYYINAQAPVTPAPPEPPAPARIVTTEKIELRHQTPSMVVRALGMDTSFPLEPSTEEQATLTPSSVFDQTLTPRAATAPAGVKTVNVNGQNWQLWGGNAYPVQNPSADGSQAQPTTGDQANRDIQELDSAGQIGFPRGGRNNGGNGRGNFPGQTGTTQANQAGTAGANAQNQGRLIPDGIDSIFPYQEDNSLLVRGEPDAIDELKNIITLLDVPVKQVSIKAEFVTVTDGDLDAFGINFTTTSLNSSVTSDIGGAGSQTGPTITVGIAQGNFNATLTALRQRSRSRTILAPLISTLNNVPAYIQTSQQYPIFQQNVLQGFGGGGNIATTSINYIPSSTGLFVLPRINRDNTVTVQITPQVSQINGFVSGPGNQSAPIIIQQQLQTVRRVASGESIVLGGLQTTSTSKTSRGIPFLEDLPFIGRLFRSADDSTNNSQLLIFLTPTIIQESTGAQVSPS